MKYLAVTDADGNFRFENVPYGTYWVGEYGTADGKTPEGYAENRTRHQVTVGSHGETVTVRDSFVNERLRGTAVLDKVSAEMCIRDRDVPSGRYLLVTLDEEGVPLANLIIFIDDGGVPLALPRTGDNSIPIALLAAALIGSAAGLVLLARYRRKDEE